MCSNRPPEPQPHPLSWEIEASQVSKTEANKKEKKKDKEKVQEEEEGRKVNIQRERLGGKEMEAKKEKWKSWYYVMRWVEIFE